MSFGFRTHLAAATLLCTATSAVYAADTLVLDANTNIVIRRVGPPEDDLHLATDVLERYLKIALRRDDLAAEGPEVDFLVEADDLVWCQLPADRRRSLGDIDGYEITVDAQRRRVHIHGSTVMAATYGVMHFLEHHLGFTWLFPGELGTATPTESTFRLVASTIKVRPDVTSRLYTGMRYADLTGMRTFRKQYGHDHPLHAERHFFEAHDYFKSLKLHFLASPSHNMINIVTPEMARQHPEMAPMLEDGMRFEPTPKAQAEDGRFQAWHPCYTASLTRAVTVEKATAAFENGAMCFSLGINDGRRVQCQCDDCRKLPWPMSYYDYVRHVASEVKGHYPPHVIGVIVYGDVRYPPDDMRLPDNVLCMVTGGSKLEKWSKHADHLGRYGYFFGSGFYVPSFPLKAMRKNAGVFRDTGVRSFRAEVYPVWAFDGPKVYIQSKLLWDLDADVDALLARWCNAAFGDGGPAMKQFYLRWAREWDYLGDLRGDGEPSPYCDMSLWRRSTAQFGRLSPQVFEEAAAHLDAARSKVRPGPQADRLDMIATYFEWSRTLFDTFHTLQTIFTGRAGGRDSLGEVFDTLRDSRRRVEELEKTIEANEQWSLGAGKQKDLERYETIDHEMYSGLLTLLLKLREKGQLRDEAAAALPPLLKQAARAEMTVEPVRRIKVFDSGGWYWALPRTQHMFEPLTPDSQGNVLRVVKKPETPVIEEGTRAGQYEEHWSFNLVPYRSAKPKRQLFRVQIDMKGRGGVLNLFLGNPWAGKPGDGLPVNAVVVFKEEERWEKVSLVIEPLKPESGHFGQNASMRFGMLFTPSDDAATFEATARIDEIILSE